MDCVSSVNLEVNYSGCFHSILVELEVKVCLFLTGFTEFRGFVFWVLVESECFDSFLLILNTILPGFLSFHLCSNWIHPTFGLLLSDFWENVYWILFS